MTMVVEASDMVAGYGGQPAIDGVSIRAAAGEVVALLGANGAGKTTTMLAVAGELPLTSGEVRLHGEATSAPLHVRARQGLAFVTEERSVIRGLTARDNLRLGNCSIAGAIALFPELEKRLAVAGGMLSGGEQQMLTLARALGRSPKILMADELSLGLAPLVVSRLLGALRAAADEHGTAVILVEQHVRKVLDVADRVYVLSRGRVVLEGTAADLRDRVEDIEEHYLSIRSDVR